MGPLTPKDHLEKLGHELESRDWPVRRRFDTTPPLLLVLAPGTRYGDSVCVMDLTGDTPCFVSSTAAPLAPVRDIANAATRTIDLITGYRPTAAYFGLTTEHPATPQANPATSPASTPGPRQSASANRPKDHPRRRSGLWRRPGR